MMHASFWWSADVGDLLFSGLVVQNVTPMVLTCLVFVILTILFEGFKVLQSKVRRDHSTRMRRAMQGICAEDRTNLLRRAVTGTSGSDQNTTSACRVLKIKFIVIASQVLLYTTNTGINYLLMLVVMLYNGYMVIAILLGITIGYFLFGHISVKYKMDQVREKEEVVTVCVPQCEEPGCLLRETDGDMSDNSAEPENQNKAEGLTTQKIGSASSQTNLNKSQVHSTAAAQHLSDQEAEVCKQTRDADCCSSKIKKMTDNSTIKSSKDASLRNKCCDSDISRDEDETASGNKDRDMIEVVSEKNKPCCGKVKKSDEKKEGVCAKLAKNQNITDGK